MPFDVDISEFFGRYVDAFACEDAATLSELWDEVGLFPTPTSNFAMPRTAFRVPRSLRHAVRLLSSPGRHAAGGGLAVR